MSSDHQPACGFASRPARPASCTSATRARRSSTGCWRAAQGGTFILRIEDTDVERSTRESERAILDDLRWLGLEWDEGAEVGGDARSVSAVRAAAHLSRARRRAAVAGTGLLLLLLRRAARGGSARRRCGQASRRSTSAAAATSRAEDARQRIEDGEPAVDSLPRAGATGSVAFDDLVRGDVSFNTDVIGDFVLVRSDGIPAYNFAVVIDDALMEITHVMRGEDHISNTPRQLLLYEAFGWTPPRFAHVSLVLGPGSRAAVEASRRDVGGGVSRARATCRRRSSTTSR